MSAASARRPAALYESMPENGGKAGQYATAYLYLLDGIAHVGAVSLYKNDSLL